MSAYPKDPSQTATPAARSPLHGILGAVREIVKTLKHSSRLRRSLKDARTAFLPTLRLDDKMLKDIGVTREEVEWAAGLPLAINAAKALHARARRRRQDESSFPRLGCVRSCVTSKRSCVIALGPSRLVSGKGFH